MDSASPATYKHHALATWRELQERERLTSPLGEQVQQAVARVSRAR